jgi:hypothetical protein
VGFYDGAEETSVPKQWIPFSPRSFSYLNRSERENNLFTCFEYSVLGV